MDGMNVHGEDPSEDLEARTKRPKLSDEEEMVPAGSGGGLSYAAVTQAENMDAESSATCGANAYQPYEDMSKTSDFSVEDDDKEFFRRQEAEAVRLLNITKMLYSLDPVDFCRRPVEVQKELERKGLLRPHDMGAQECISLRCIKLNLVRHYDRHHNLLERLVDFAPYMPCDDETGKQVEWLKEKGHLTSLCNSHISEYNIFLALQELGVVFYNMQWSYHPLITEGHRDDFVTIIKRVAGVVRQTLKQNHEEFDGLQLSGGDFINNLVNKCKETSPRERIPPTTTPTLSCPPGGGVG